VGFNGNPRVRTPSQGKQADRDFAERYDLTRDPHEFENLWKRPAQVGLREGLPRQLVSRMTRAIDPTFKELPAPSNKGAYGDYLKQWGDLRIRYPSC
jgi:hypothetical protein